MSGSGHNPEFFWSGGCRENNLLVAKWKNRIVGIADQESLYYQLRGCVERCFAISRIAGRG
jgi:hypothetical protein